MFFIFFKNSITKNTLHITRTRLQVYNIGCYFGAPLQSLPTFRTQKKCVRAMFGMDKGESCVLCFSSGSLSSFDKT